MMHSCGHLDTDHGKSGCLHPDINGKDLCPCDSTREEILAEHGIYETATTYDRVIP